MIYVYTVILNGWDNLQPAIISNNDQVRYVCFTNVPQLPAVRPWEIRPVYEIGEASRTARLPKILPHLFLPDAEYSIYHDGNFCMTAGPGALIDGLLAGYDWAAHRHPCRRCIYDEAAVLLKEKIGTADLVEAEVARYRDMGYPAQGGLWANGLLARRHTPAVIRTCEAWWKLYAAGCERDQLSFPVARRAEGLAVRTIDADIYSSPYAGFSFHAAWKDKRPNPEYRGERAAIRAQLARLSEVAGPGAGIRYPEY